MDDCSWMYRDSLKVLHMIDYCNWVEDVLLITHYLI